MESKFEILWEIINPYLNDIFPKKKYQHSYYEKRYTSYENQKWLKMTQNDQYWTKYDHKKKTVESKLEILWEIINPYLNNIFPKKKYQHSSYEKRYIPKSTKKWPKITKNSQK